MQLIQKKFSYMFYTKPLIKNVHSLVTLDICYIESKKSETCVYFISYIIKNTEAKIIHAEKVLSKPFFIVQCYCEGTQSQQQSIAIKFLFLPHILQHLRHIAAIILYHPSHSKPPNSVLFVCLIVSSPWKTQNVYPFRNPTTPFLFYCSFASHISKRYQSVWLPIFWHTCSYHKSYDH
jgi:hypothetical protein